MEEEECSYREGRTVDKMEEEEVKEMDRGTEGETFYHNPGN